MSGEQRDWTENLGIEHEYAREFGKAMSKLIAELREIEQHPDFDPAFCGL